MNGRLSKFKFGSPRILLDFRDISNIILGKYTHKLIKKNTNQVLWGTQGGDFNTNYTSKVEILLPEIYATKIMT